MTSGNFGERFYSYRKPMWHFLGTVGEEPQSAVRTFLPMYYDVYLESLKSASGLYAPGQAIVRSPTKDDPESVVLGVVGPMYELITPIDICSGFDRKVHQPVETMGAINQGSQFFCTVQLPSWEVGGDEIDNYLLIDAPINGGGLYIRETDVRVVCWNTLVMARAHSTQFYKVRHISGAVLRFEDWLEYAWSKAVANVENVKELFGFLSRAPVPDEMTPILLQSIYPDPKPPVRDAPSSVMEVREARYEQQKKWYSDQRSLAEQLFQGAGVGQDTPAAKGTAWGLWNAVCELNDYGGSGDPVVMARDAIFGWRAQIKETAFSVLLDYTTSL